MSYGTFATYASKKALKEDVEKRGAANVGVFGTSMFGDENAHTIADLADSGNVIVGPHVENNRKWYANAITKRDGTISIK